ncbi:MAG: hypothetical protein ABSH20_10045 [Tepidisphaeraceae bacterium]|jgi:hypothetical protein
MRNLLIIIAGVLAGCELACAAPAQELVTGKMPGNVLAGGSNRVFILNPEGKVVWEHKTGLVHDAWMLASGNVLYADGGTVTEITPDHKVVFQYKSEEQRGGGTYSCQRLENGNTAIGENSTGRVLEVDKDGKVVFELKTSPAAMGAHHNMRMVRKLENGNYLVSHSGAHLVKEYAPDGKVVLEIKTPNLAFAAIRTEANTTLVSNLDHIYEYDATGKAVWEVAAKDIAGATVTNMTGLHLLADGNIAVGCYAAYKGGEGTGLFEITRDRKLVWRYSNPKADSSMMAIQCLDAESKPLSGKCRR